LFSGLPIQADRAAGKSGNIEIKLRADALELEHRAQTVKA